MFFTKPQWRAPYKIVGETSDFWQIAGVSHLSTTFVVRSAHVERDEPDAYSFVVAQADALLPLLESFVSAPPRVFAIDWDRMIPVVSLWSCRERSRSKFEFLAYGDENGILRSCDPRRSDLNRLRIRTLLWERLDADATMKPVLTSA
ncbi:hypothetical protein PPMP20_29965 [Paraburkholderia phymatum]|uniref:Uncharacterized protein n=2 Tax=Paraburkholderia TaxID=1822464 RepID=B2JS04_PARP8|nr:hypothetical protein [Paraburkholderia phymatum]ACC73923.1 conserved hypothetical protein [Paraburkholderia phymatum STM815]PTB28658.1 hypothetical protein C9I56_11695 [Paraburkholderia caribensis]QLB66043.1 hypothetical protein A9O66_27495 [Paraburkholderia caribensis]